MNTVNTYFTCRATVLRWPTQEARGELEADTEACGEHEQDRGERDEEGRVGRAVGRFTVGMRGTRGLHPDDLWDDVLWALRRRGCG